MVSIFLIISTVYSFLSGYYKLTNKTNGEPFQCRDIHNYYLWVPYVLVASGFLFMLPNQLWRYLEEGKIASIVRGIRDEALE